MILSPLTILIKYAPFSNDVTFKGMVWTELLICIVLNTFPEADMSDTTDGLSICNPVVLMYTILCAGLGESLKPDDRFPPARKPAKDILAVVRGFKDPTVMVTGAEA